MNGRAEMLEKGLAQSEMGSKSAEEINLIHKIDNCTRNLLQGLNSIESLIIGVNKGLLPPKLAAEAKSEKDARPPQGWFERHLADLDIILSRSAKIYAEINRLNRETKTDIK